MKLSVFFFSVLFCLILNSVVAQNSTDERVLIGGKKFLLHTVSKGETVVSLCRDYHLDKNVLFAENPELSDELDENMVIRIPLETKATAGKPSLTNYEVQAKQTVFSIARKFGITPDVLYQYNPEARNGIKTGQMLKIPVMGATAEPSSAESAQKTTTARPDMSARQENTTVVKQAVAPAVNKPAPVAETEKEPVTTSSAKTAPRYSDVYFTHLLQPGETVFDLQKRYGINRDALLALNPALAESPAVGTRVKIPADNFPVVSSEPVDERNFIQHKVAAGEGFYLLCSKYKVHPGELRKANPTLDYREPVAGDNLWIPRHQTEALLPDSIVENFSSELKYHWSRKPETCRPDKQKQQQTYRVALMIPLYLDANDTIDQYQEQSVLPDTLTSEQLDTIPVRRLANIDPRSENFLHFYEGFLMAADSLRKAGMKLELYVYDTQQKESTINRIIQSDEFRDMDLIIGPVFPELQAAVSAFSAKNRIPMVSPLSAAGNYEKTNPYYFKINPTKDYLITQTARFIADEYFDKNILVLKMGDYSALPESRLVNYTREGLSLTGYYQQQKKNLFNQYDFETEKLEGLRNSLLPEQENVVIIPASAEAQLSVAVSNLNAASGHTSVRLVGLSTFKRYKSIQPEYFHRTQLTFLSHYFIDYQSPRVNHFVSRFRRQFATEPNEFSFQGFDISYYFMSALCNFGKDFPSCISGYEKNLLQLNLNMQRISPVGGFMNQGLYIVEYGKDFSVKSIGTFGPKYLKPAE